MSSLSSIISQVNSLSGFLIPTGSESYIISSSVPLTSGSVNAIINQINNLTGYNVPGTSVTFVSGSNIAGSPTVIYAPTPVSGTISTDGIYPGAVIKADHVLRIINALNGVAQNAIVISGSLDVSGSAVFRTILDLPFVPNENLLVSDSGSIEGTDTVDGGSY